MGAATRIAVKDLKLRVRDRSAFVLGIFTPLALALIFHLVFGNVFATESLDLQIGLVDLDNTEISRVLEEILVHAESEGLLDLTTFGDTGAADAAAEEGEVGAYIMLGPGLGDAALAGTPFTIQVVGDVDSGTTTQVAEAIAAEFGSGVGRVQLSVATALEVGESPTPPDVATWGALAAERPPAYVFSDVSAEARQLDASTFFAAGMAVFFLMFTVQFGVVGMLEEERDGTLARLLAAPIGRGSVVGGKALISFALGAISMTVLVVATRFLMGANWGPPLGVAVLVVAGVLAATAIMALIASVAKSAEGAGNLGAIVAVVLGMLGGTFFPIGQQGGVLAQLTYLTPHAWFMRGLADISGGAEWTAALPAAGALLLFAVVFGSVGWGMLGRRLAR